MSISSTSNEGKAAIFDLDGTLLDSMRVWDVMDVKFFAGRGIECPQDFSKSVASMQFHEIAVYVKQRFHFSDTPEELMAIWNRMAAYEYAHNVVPKPHAVAYVRHLHETGAKLAIATTLPPTLREPAMKHAGLAPYVHTVCSTGDGNCRGKEYPDIYLYAARLLGVRPESCTVFEDLLTAVHSAQSAGMQTWAMYDASSEKDWAAIQLIADGTLNDFSDAPSIL
ncbi:MAG: HAD family phosphatase [Bifidobacterium aquikefiri]|uniref:Beta-phosphoglucomutase n=1 Tax=Bifidobacterium aquikefiri TaxID=1653207 RepID=A0A261G2E7_9BIFI|nr:HAD family phosphatase [Bifidobacterium aquikefiri]OZG65415.1 beta-phosphoglucomutase [Bifidobacterium aquikefiri]